MLRALIATPDDYFAPPCCHTPRLRHDTPYGAATPLPCRHAAMRFSLTPLRRYAVRCAMLLSPARLPPAYAISLISAMPCHFDDDAAAAADAMPSIFAAPRDTITMLLRCHCHARASAATSADAADAC